MTPVPTQTSRSGVYPNCMASQVTRETSNTYWDPPSLKIARLSARHYRLPARDAPQSKVGLAAERAKNIANVVGRFDACLERVVPVGEDALDNLDASVVDVVNGNDEAVLIHQPQVLEGRDAGRLSIEVGAYAWL